MPSTRARAVITVGLAVKPVGKPDAGNPHVRFDERGREMGCCRMAQATAPVLDSTGQRPQAPGDGGYGPGRSHMALVVGDGGCWGRRGWTLNADSALRPCHGRIRRLLCRGR